MLPADAQLYKCPHCGHDKPMLSLLSGNTFGGELWSDGYSRYPMLPTLSEVQKCPKCGKYSLMTYWRNTGKRVAGSSGVTGNLSYTEAKEAFIELSTPSQGIEDVCSIALFFIRAFNNEFKRPLIRKAISEGRSVSSISAKFPVVERDDFRLFLEASHIVIENFGKTEEESLIKAEIYRELGQWEQAKEILLGVQQSDNLWIVDIMMYHIGRRDHSLLPLVIDGRKIDYSRKPNFNALINDIDESQLADRKKNIERFMSLVPEDSQKDLLSDELGGIMTKHSKTFLKLVSPSPKRYDIAETCRTVGDYSFFRNFDIESVRFPRSLRAIGVKAFYACKNLKNIQFEVPEIESLGDCAFMNCKSLKSIEFTSKVRYIGWSAFAGMDNLEAISLSDELETIPEFAFFECFNLLKVTIPASVKRLGSYSFQCTGIKEINIPDEVEWMGDAVFSRCSKLKKVRISKKLDAIPERSFESCKELESIEIPKSVSAIGRNAFEGTTSMHTIRFHGKVNNIDPTAFNGAGVEKVFVPWGTKKYYQQFFSSDIIKVTLFLK